VHLQQGAYYHLYNRTNNSEIAFKSHENYLHFLRRYRHYLETRFETLAYCLMPTHFHFLVLIRNDDIRETQDQIGVWFSSYTKALNKELARHGSLFQNHTKAKLVDNERYLLTLATYIHQNPVRAGLIASPDPWLYSSYQDYSELRKGTLVSKQMINNYFHSTEEFIQFSQTPIKQIDARYWA